MQIKGKGNAEFVIAVCDDNPKVRRKIAVILKEKLSQESFWWYVIEFESAEEVLAYSSCHNNSCITLLFLDIEMEGMNGIQLMQQLVDSDSVWRIVFVTNHTENILSSFSIKTIGFIVKPIMVEEINKKLQIVLNEWKKNKSIICKDINGKYLVFKYESILYFKADRNYCKIFFLNEKGLKIESILLDERIGKLEKNLLDMNFLRIHRSYLVNLLHVDTIHEKVKIDLEQVNLPLGRNYRERAKHTFLVYVADKVRERI